MWTHLLREPLTKRLLNGPESSGGCNCSDVIFGIGISKLEVVINYWGEAVRLFFNL